MAGEPSLSRSGREVHRTCPVEPLNTTNGAVPLPLTSGATPVLGAPSLLYDGDGDHPGDEH